MLDNKLEWSTNTEAVYKKGLRRLYFLSRLRPFNVFNWMSQGMGIKAKDADRLNKLIRKAGSVVGCKLVTLEEVAEDWMLAKLLAGYHGHCLLPHPLWTSLRATLATDSFNPTTKRNSTGNHSYLVPSDCITHTLYQSNIFLHFKNIITVNKMYPLAPYVLLAFTS